MILAIVGWFLLVPKVEAPAIIEIEIEKARATITPENDTTQNEEIICTTDCPLIIVPGY